MCATRPEWIRHFGVQLPPFGRIDYVVNCAGIVVKYGELSATLQTEDCDRTINVNLRGNSFVLRAALQQMTQ